jgi:hypothetical protein
MSHTRGKRYSSVEDRLKTYEHRLTIADAQFQEWARQAERFIARYCQDRLPTQVTPEGHVVTTADGTATIDALFSSLTAVQVDVSITGIAGGSWDQAAVAQMAVRDVMREQKVQRKAADAIKDALVCDIGFVKVGYEYADHEEPKDAEELGEELDAYTMRRFEETGEIPDPEEVSEVVDPSKLVVDVDRVVVDYVPWDEVRWDVTARRWEDIRWVAQLSYMRPEEVKYNEEFRAYVKGTKGGGLRKLDELPTTHRTAHGLPSDMYGSIQPSEDDERVLVYTFYDLEEGTICTFAKGSNFLLSEKVNILGFHDDLEDRNPFVALVLRRGPGRVKGVGDMRLTVNSLDELDMYRSYLASYIDYHRSKLMVKSGTLTEAGKKALESRAWNAVVETELSANLNSDVLPITPPVLPQEVFGIPEKLSNAIRESTGVNELMRGFFPDRKRTATETQEVVLASAGRQAEKRNQLAAFYENIARRILWFIQRMYDSDQITRETGWEGDIDWEWSPEDIAGEVGLEVALTPKEEMTMALRAERALTLQNLLGTPDIAPDVDQRELKAFILEELGYPRQLISRLLKSDEQIQADKQAALQEQAAAQEVVEGAPPDASMIPGPLSAEELIANVNPGEIPPSVAAGGAGAAPTSEEAVAGLISR